MARMRRESDAAAHHNAVHEGDIRFREFLDPGVEDVLFPPQDLAEVTIDLRTFPERTDVAAGTQATLAGTFQHDHGNGGIGLKTVERPIDVPKHLQRHGVDRLRTVERDNAGRALDPRDQVALLYSTHRAPSINLRATISR